MAKMHDHDLDHEYVCDPDKNSIGSAEKAVDPSPPKKPGKLKKPPLREREPENDMERVEKAYLENWDSLFSEGKVKTPDPIVNWNQTRALLKRHFEKLKADQIINALKNGMVDNFVVSGGYSLGTMLSAAVLNRLVNAKQGPPLKTQADWGGNVDMGKGVKAKQFFGG
ncbi:MAG: hypothetical protein LBP76_09595 [Treponema sp.]|nr:hypothetical protein [Treponema sp.]